MQINDSIRQWIAENIILGSEPEGIMHVLKEQGFDSAQVAQEVRNILASPFLAGTRRLVNRLAKRDWMLDVYRKLDRLRPDFGVVPREHRLSREEFLRNYYCLNRPVIITGMLDDWPALKKWNLDYLEAQFGAREIEVQVNRNSNQRYEIEQHDANHRQVLKLGDVISRIRANEKTNDFYVTAGNTSMNREVLHELWQDITQIPEYLDGSAANDGFFWLGPAGTLTPLHHDLTNNFMAQVYGRKSIKLVPGYDTARVYNLLHCYSSVDPGNFDQERFPLFSEANQMEVVLNPGEILFLPIGCWHYVEALDPSITMSFTNFIADNDFHSFYRTYQEV